MEFNGIPLGHIYKPDYSTPTLVQKPIKVASLKDLEELIGPLPSDKTTVDYTNLDDIDDTMDIETARIGLVGGETPELPQRDFNIRTLTNDKIEQVKKDEADGGVWNATYN